MKMNLEHGFLFLYDWLPMLEDLSGDGVKELLLALIDRQRNGVTEPTFSDPRSAFYFRIVLPTIERRLAGQRGGQKAQKNGSREAGRVVPTQPSKAKRSKEKQSIAIAERSSAEREEERAQDERIHAPDAPIAPRPPLSEEEKENLISFGIPENYVEQRLSRAVGYAREQGKSVAEVLLDWWDQDRRVVARKPTPQRSPMPSRPADGEIGFTCNSFDTDDFFQAALKKSMMSP